MNRRKDAPDLAVQVAAFAEHCRTRGLSVTRQRLAIFEALAGSREHPSAEDIHRAVRRRLPHLSLATVYKNLEALRDIGAVSDVNALHEHGRYEAALPGTGAGTPHHHLVCVDCRKVVDLHDSRLDAGSSARRGDRRSAPGLSPRCRSRRSPRCRPSRSRTRRASTASRRCPGVAPPAGARRHCAAGRAKRRR
ncbi:MAG: transcriptional repressor [Deltaproteobacteria bacterium]|nr:MAG: transcriptional repressor [Deltaproteobacteria bacterium]